MKDSVLKTVDVENALHICELGLEYSVDMEYKSLPFRNIYM